jgi:peptide/nickel transport system permease protein
MIKQAAGGALKQVISTRRRLFLFKWKYIRLTLSSLVILLFSLVALFPSLFATHNPNAIDTEHRLEGPSANYWLGTDDLGRDTYSRIIYGARPSFLIAIGAVLISITGGVPLGLIGGYYGGVAGMLTMRFVDVLLCFPPIILAIFFAGFVGKGVGELIIIIGILFAPRMARVVHGATLSVRDSIYVEAQKAIGASNLRIVMRGIIPNILAPIIVQATLQLAAAILLESGLAFLGLGVPPPAPSWGAMIGRGRFFMKNTPSGVIFPAGTLALIVLVFNTFGDGLRDFLDPRLRRLLR